MADDGEKAVYHLTTVLNELRSFPYSENLHRSAYGILTDRYNNPALMADHTALVRALLEILFQGHVVHPDSLSLLTATMLDQTYHPGLDKTEEPDDLFKDMAGDPLLLLLLSKTINRHPGFEMVLTRLRCHLLFAYNTSQACTDEVLPLLMALSRQCFNNEYIFVEQEDERRTIEQRITLLDTMVDGPVSPSGETLLTIVSMYRPLRQLSVARRMAEIPLVLFSDVFRQILIQQIHEPFEEQALARQMPSFSVISDSTSQAVRLQYEENPYPRWLNIYGQYETIDALIKRKEPSFSWPDTFNNTPLRILVPGCGTGQHPLVIASGNPEAHITAIDLSKHSIAYAIRMAEKLHIHNVTFLHGDLLDIPVLKQCFHHIDCVGVLHHLANPMDGWHVLEKILLPGGTMHIGLYSQVARLPVVFFRNEIKKQQIAPVAESMRAFRHQLMTDKRYELLYRSVSSADFYSMSTLRDLLFHECEYHYTLSEIQRIINPLGFQFLGFNIHSSTLKNKYRAQYPDDEQMTNLDHWREFERYYAGTRCMFDFWLQKKEE